MNLFDLFEDDPSASDRASVAQWLSTTPDNIEIEVKQESIKPFLKQIQEMYDSYDEFPKDARRTKKIMKAIQAGEEIYPIYVEKGDPHLFVMEGRHRMVAFMLLGMKKIPVAWVSCKDDSCNNISKYVVGQEVLAK